MTTFTVLDSRDELLLSGATLKEAGEAILRHNRGDAFEEFEVLRSEPDQGWQLWCHTPTASDKEGRPFGKHLVPRLSGTAPFISKADAENEIFTQIIERADMFAGQKAMTDAVYAAR